MIIAQRLERTDLFWYTSYKNFLEQKRNALKKGKKLIDTTY
jgi:hypothetical protein